jgi:tetratricopeptide (TPR) repeat protein
MGYATGLDDRDQQIQATQSAELQHQYDLGVADLAANRYSVAAERFEYILNRDPQFPGAAEKLQQAQIALNARATNRAPTPAPAITARGESPAEMLALAEEYAQDQNWGGVIAQIALLHSVNPKYETVRSDALLFTALRNRGIARINGDAMEAGIADLDQATAFSPLDDEARSYRAWARLYLAGKSHYGVNWSTASEIFGQLIVLAPNFKDTTQLYYDSVLSYAKQLEVAGDPCAAATYYAIAQPWFNDAATTEALTASQTLCAQVTPTPEAVPTSDVTATPTP